MKAFSILRVVFVFGFLFTSGLTTQAQPTLSLKPLITDLIDSAYQKIIAYFEELEERSEVVARAFGLGPLNVGDTSGPITFIDTLDFDPSGSLDLANGPKFTAPKTGFYRVNVSSVISFPHNSIPTPDSWSFQMWLKIDGNSDFSYRSIASTGGTITLQINDIVYLQEGQTLETFEEFDVTPNDRLGQRNVSRLSVELVK